MNFQTDFNAWVDILVDRYKSTEYKQSNDVYINLVDYETYDSYNGVRVANIFFYRIGTTIYERELPQYIKMITLAEVASYTSLENLDTRVTAIIESLFDYIRINDTTSIYISDVCGLQNALDQKADINHVHTACQVNVMIDDIYVYIDTVCSNMDASLTTYCQSTDIKIENALDCFNLTVKALDSTLPIRVGDVLEFVGDNTNINVRIDGMNRLVIESCTNWSNYTTAAQLCTTVSNLKNYTDVCSNLVTSYVDEQIGIQQNYTDICVNNLNQELSDRIDHLDICSGGSTTNIYAYIDACAARLDHKIDVVCNNLVSYVNVCAASLNLRIDTVCRNMGLYVDACAAHLNVVINSVC